MYYKQSTPSLFTIPTSLLPCNINQFWTNSIIDTVAHCTATAQTKQFLAKNNINNKLDMSAYGQFGFCQTPSVIHQFSYHLSSECGLPPSKPGKGPLRLVSRNETSTLFQKFRVEFGMVTKVLSSYHLRSWSAALVQVVNLMFMWLYLMIIIFE